MEFCLFENVLASRIGVGGDSSIAVRTTNLQALVQQAALQWGSLIMDIEGAEIEVTSKEINLLQQRFECLIIEFHDGVRGADVNAAAIEKLQETGFRKLGQIRGTIAMRNTGRPGAEPAATAYLPFRYAIRLAGSSLMIPSTLASTDRAQSASVFAVHGTTWRPARCAAATFSGVTR